MVECTNGMHALVAKKERGRGERRGEREERERERAL